MMLRLLNIIKYYSLGKLIKAMSGSKQWVDFFQLKISWTIFLSLNIIYDCLPNSLWDIFVSNRAPRNQKPTKYFSNLERSLIIIFFRSNSNQQNNSRELPWFYFIRAFIIKFPFFISFVDKLPPKAVCAEKKNIHEKKLNLARFERRKPRRSTHEKA